MSDQIYMLISELIPFIATLTSFIYGLKSFFKKGMPLYLQSITMAMGCHMLGSLYNLCQLLTLKAPFEGFTPSYLGRIGFFLFFIAASYGQMDRIVDDGSKKFRPSRRISLVAPLLAILLFVPSAISKQIPLSTKVSCLLVWVPACASLYYNLKHVIIPDLDFGFVKAIKPYNMLALCLGFSELLCLTVRNYGYNIWLIVASVLFSALCIATIIAGKRGVKKWTI